MFLQVSVILPTGGGACVAKGVCVVKGVCMVKGGMCGQGLCGIRGWGMHGGVCMAGRGVTLSHRVLNVKAAHLSAPSKVKAV